MLSLRVRGRQIPLRYRVEGMDCPSCASKIETAVGRLGGAGDIRVNYHTQVLAFRLDEATTPRATVEAHVRKLGYRVAPVEAPRVAAGTGQASERCSTSPCARTAGCSA